MKTSICKIMAGVALVLSPVKAMYEEEALKLPQAKLAQHNINIAPQMSYKEEAPFETLPDELLVSIFNFIDVSDLGRVAQVSTRWKKVVEDPDLWRYMGSRYYGDYLSEKDLREDPKQKVIYHYLSVVVNMAENVQEIERLVRCYRLDLYVPPFKKYIESNFLTHLVTDLSSRKELIAQGNKDAIKKKQENLLRESDEVALRELNELLVEKGDQGAIKRKIEGLLQGKNGYKKDLATARDFNDSLVEKRDVEAIKRKIDGLLYGKDGYDRDPPAAKEFNEFLVKKGDQVAIWRKVDNIPYGINGYEEDPAAVREFNESLVAKGDLNAIGRKIKGFTDGKYGYEKDLAAARKFNELLVAKGDPQAIERKIQGLTDGKYGYKKDLLAARELNELLAGEGNQEAIQRKIEGLSRGGDIVFKSYSAYDQYSIYYDISFGCSTTYLPSYGYEKDPGAAREFNESLVEKGDLGAIKRKINGLAGGYYGYEKNPDAVREFNEFLVEKGDQAAIERKIYGLAKGSNGYKADPVSAREFIESLLVSEIPIARAFGKYIKAFAWKYGVPELGYEREYERAIEFIKQHHVPY